VLKKHTLLGIVIVTGIPADTFMQSVPAPFSYPYLCYGYRFQPGTGMGSQRVRRPATDA
jgi:hypothetical protein